MRSSRLKGSAARVTSRHYAVLGAFLGLISIFAILAIDESSARLPRALATLVIVAGPGLAWVPLLRIRDPGLAALLALVVSVSSVILIAQIVTYAAGFSWRPCAFVLLSITVIGLLTQALIGTWRPS